MFAPITATQKAVPLARDLLLRSSPRLLQQSPQQASAALRCGALQPLPAEPPAPWQPHTLRDRLGCFVYRWLDVTGLLTRWHSRKAWVLELDPHSRLAAPLITEYERKMIMFVGFHAYFFFFVAMYLAAKGHAHAAVKPPVPRCQEFPGVDGRKKDFTWHGRLFFIEPKERCKECRWLDLECKKNCFEQLKAQGHTLVINNGNPLSVPRAYLEAPHTH